MKPPYSIWRENANGRVEPLTELVEKQMLRDTVGQATATAVFYQRVADNLDEKQIYSVRDRDGNILLVCRSTLQGG